MKIVINDCIGGFGLSDEAIELYLTKSGQTPFYKQEYNGFNMYSSEPFVKDGKVYITDGKIFQEHNLARNDPILIEVIEQLGKKADGEHAELKIVDIPDDVKWEITQHGGNETIREKSRSWS